MKCIFSPINIGSQSSGLSLPAWNSSSTRTHYLHMIKPWAHGIFFMVSTIGLEALRNNHKSFSHNECWNSGQTIYRKSQSQYPLQIYSISLYKRFQLINYSSKMLFINLIMQNKGKFPTNALDTLSQTVDIRRCSRSAITSIGWHWKRKLFRTSFGGRLIDCGNSFIFSWAT